MKLFYKTPVCFPGRWVYNLIYIKKPPSHEQQMDLALKKCSEPRMWVMNQSLFSHKIFGFKNVVKSHKLNAMKKWTCIKSLQKRQWNLLEETVERKVLNEDLKKKKEKKGLSNPLKSGWMWYMHSGI